MLLGKRAATYNSMTRDTVRTTAKMTDKDSHAGNAGPPRSDVKSGKNGARDRYPKNANPSLPLPPLHRPKAHVGKDDSRHRVDNDDSMSGKGKNDNGKDGRPPRRPNPPFVSKTKKAKDPDCWIVVCEILYAWVTDRQPREDEDKTSNAHESPSDAQHSSTSTALNVSLADTEHTVFRDETNTDTVDPPRNALPDGAHVRRPPRELSTMRLIYGGACAASTVLCFEAFETATHAMKKGCVLNANFDVRLRNSDSEGALFVASKTWLERKKLGKFSLQCDIAGVDILYVPRRAGAKPILVRAKRNQPKDGASSSQTHTHDAEQLRNPRSEQERRYLLRCFSEK